MKTTTLITSFVAIALLAARRSFAIVVRSQVNFPGLAVPRPSLPQQSDVPLSYQAKRHLAATSAMVQRDDEERDVTHAQILNFALSLELPEGEFYKRKKADYPAWVRGRFEQIYEDIFFSLVPDFRPYGI